jgi:hypothetical protein
VLSLNQISKLNVMRRAVYFHRHIVTTQHAGDLDKLDAHLIT